MWSLGFWIVEARQKKLLKRLIASPMPRWQYLASFVFWRLLLLPIEVGVFLGFAHFAFGVPARGSFLQLALLCVLASLTFSANIAQQFQIACTETRNEQLHRNLESVPSDSRHRPTPDQNQHDPTRLSATVLVAPYGL